MSFSRRFPNPVIDEKGRGEASEWDSFAHHLALMALPLTTSIPFVSVLANKLEVGRNGGRERRKQIIKKHWNKAQNH